MRGFNPEFSAMAEMFEQPKNKHEQLKSVLGDISRAINHEAQERYGVKTLVDEDGKISIKGFNNRKEGGIYDENVLMQSKAKVKKLELEFSGADNPVVQKFYKDKYGVEGQEAIATAWKENKEKEKNGQMEMAITILLHKILKDQYLVLRTHDFDDYMHGADNIIVDKQTGAVIGAFDEVHEGGQGERQRAKEAKVQRIAEHGGAHIQYGIELEGESLKRSALDHVPVFYLGLTTDQLDRLLGALGPSAHSPISEVERETFELLLSSLKEQVGALQQLPGNSPVKKHIEAFADSLPRLASYIKPK